MEIREFTEFKSSPAIQEKLLSYGIVRNFSEGEIILNENSYIKAIPIVTKGIIRVMRTEEDGRELLLYYIQPGESCIMSFLGGIHQDTSKVKAIADEETTLLLVPIDKVHDLIKEFPEWLDYIFKLYHKRFEELLDVVNSMAFKKMDQRLLEFLRKKCAINNSKSLYITHEQIAQDLGTSRVVITRLLKQLESEGLVQVLRNKITLLTS